MCFSIFVDPFTHFFFSDQSTLFSFFLLFEYIAGFYKQIQKKQPLELPPRPPATRNWKVSNVSPFAGNNMLVLYSCPIANSSDEYFVQVLHNEEPIAMPVSALTITRSLVSLFLIHSSCFHFH